MQFSGPFDKAGTRQTAEGLNLQRYLCRECNHRFSEPNPYKLTKTNSDHQLCVILQDAKKLEPQHKSDVVAISQNQTHQTTTQGEIIDFLWHLKKQGKYSDATIKTRVKILTYLSEKHGLNLHDPEAVRTLLATNEKWSNGYKQNIVATYDSPSLKCKKSVGTPHTTKTEKTLPFVPLEKEVDALVAGCTKKVGTCILALKETGFRIGELWQCKWTDLDEENFHSKMRS